MANIRSLKKCVAMVTGGASGLGLATVQRFVKKGARVVICDLPSSDGENIAKQLNSEHSKCCVFAPTDVTSEEQAMEAMALTQSSFSRLDVLVNCAAIAETYSLYNFNKKLPIELEPVQDNMAVNTVGSFNMVRLAAELMRENKRKTNLEQRGVIINTSCIAATDGGKGQVAFAASKGAVVGMTLPIARDLASDGIRCVTIAPGYMDTPMNSPVPQFVIDFLCRLCAFPNALGSPEVYAHAVQMVVENPMLNGTVIRLDAGARPVF